MRREVIVTNMSVLNQARAEVERLLEGAEPFQPADPESPTWFDLQQVMKNGNPSHYLEHDNEIALAIRWGRRMQQVMAAGNGTLTHAQAVAAANEVDFEGRTLLANDVARVILERVWVHGQHLKTIFAQA